MGGFKEDKNISICDVETRYSASIKMEFRGEGVKNTRNQIWIP